MASMNKKIVFEVTLHFGKTKKEVKKTVSGISGVTSVDMQGNRLTVTGNIDPAVVISKLRLLCDAKVVSGNSQTSSVADALGANKSGGKKTSANTEEMVGKYEAYRGSSFTNFPK